jgi:hypothetical protein
MKNTQQKGEKKLQKKRKKKTDQNGRIKVTAPAAPRFLLALFRTQIYLSAS